MQSSMFGDASADLMDGRNGLTKTETLPVQVLEHKERHGKNEYDYDKMRGQQRAKDGPLLSCFLSWSLLPLSIQKLKEHRATNWFSIMGLSPYVELDSILFQILTLCMSQKSAFLKAKD
eukprot:6025325-Amphidinium_carterae.1